MRQATCDEVREHAPELAIGALDGAERAPLVAHLEDCPACRVVVARYARVADALYLAAPEADPTAGFEARILGADWRPRRGAPLRARRWIAAAAAVLILVTLAFAGGRWTTDSDVRVGAMRDHSKDVVGHAFVYDGRPAAVFVAIDGWGDGGDYVVEVVTHEGRHVRLSDISLTGGRGAGGGTLSIPLSAVREVWVRDLKTKEWCGFRL